MRGEEGRRRGQDWTAQIQQPRSGSSRLSRSQQLPASFSLLRIYSELLSQLLALAARPPLSPGHSRRLCVVHLHHTHLDIPLTDVVVHEPSARSDNLNRLLPFALYPSPLSTLVKLFRFFLPIAPHPSMGQNQSHRVDDDRDPDHLHAPLNDASHPSPPPSPPPPPPPPAAAPLQHGRPPLAPSDFLSSPFSFPSLPPSLFSSFPPPPPPSQPPHPSSSPPSLPLPPPLSSPPSSFPRLTLAQMSQLRDAGVDLDLAFVPYQMPRLTSHAVTEEGGEREKE